MRLRIDQGRAIYFAIAITVLLAMAISSAIGRSSTVFLPAAISLILVLLIPSNGLNDITVLLKLVALHLFAISPVYIVVANVDFSFGHPPSDWYGWLTRMAWVNVAALGLFLTAMRLSEGRIVAKQTWVLDTRRFRYTLLALLGLSGVAQIMVYRSFGGLSGFVESYEARSDAFQGMGLIFAVSESFPILVVMAYAVAAKRVKFLRNTWMLLALIAVFILLKFAFGGLRGSRGNIIWATFWAFGMIEIWVRRVPRAILAGFGAIGILFVFVYGFYKAAGSDVALEAMTGDLGEAAMRTGRGIDYVIVNDLSRAEIQAYLLYRMENSFGNYANGRTYVGTLALVMPRWLWPDRPESKRKYATEILYSPEVAAGGFRSSRAYGLGGEALINFGIPGVLLAYAVFGCLVGLARGFSRSLGAGDPRLLFVPLGACWFALALMNDSDNLFFFMVKHGLVPLLLILVSSRRTTQSLRSRYQWANGSAG